MRAEEDARAVSTPLLRGHLETMVLASLVHGSRHGYAIVADLGNRTGGAVQLTPGAVYPVLHRLERDGLVLSSWSVVAGRRRRTYSLTGTGAAALVRRRQEWRMVQSLVQTVLVGSGAEADPGART